MPALFSFIINKDLYLHKGVPILPHHFPTVAQKVDLLRVWWFRLDMTAV